MVRCRTTIQLFSKMEHIMGSWRHRIYSRAGNEGVTSICVLLTLDFNASVINTHTNSSNSAVVIGAQYVIDIDEYLERLTLYA